MKHISICNHQKRKSKSAAAKKIVRSLSELISGGFLAIWYNFATGGRLCEVSNNNKSATTMATAIEAVEVAVPAAAGRPSSVLRLQHQ